LELKDNMPDERRKAIFIDRDGTLVEEVNYLSRVEDLRLFPFTVDAVRRLKAAGFLLIVVTNQSGIGRGIFEEGAMHEIHRAIQQQLSNAVDAFYFCPHLPCDGCRCRKPGLGMIERAMSDFSIDIENSWMIGDKKIDVETGINAGSKTAMVRTGYGAAHSGQLSSEPSLLVNDLLEAALAIISQTDAPDKVGSKGL
jgi:D-glycero-D-manno-heptose 1,7-bisphosphate phosphatase